MIRSGMSGEVIWEYPTRVFFFVKNKINQKSIITVILINKFIPLELTPSVVESEVTPHSIIHSESY